MVTMTPNPTVPPQAQLETQAVVYSHSKRPIPPTTTHITNKKPYTPSTSSRSSSNPLEIKPLGQLFFQPVSHLSIRSKGLGMLSMLPDELLLSHLFSSFDAVTLMKAQALSKTFFGWSRVEGIWKAVYIEKSKGRLFDWHGSWRSSYIKTFLLPSTTSKSEPLPTLPITTPRLYSDVLFQPSLCAAFDPIHHFSPPSFVSNIRRIAISNLKNPSDLPVEPCIITEAMVDWPSISSSTPSRNWTLPALTERFREQPLFRAEATLTNLSNYQSYHDHCELDESPLIVFDSDFVRKTGESGVPGLGDDYQVPACFGEDLFEVMNEERPDYRWLIIGPARSGSTWHQDPNGTSAWNAVTAGSKAWVMFPPHITPPGVYVSSDQGQVEAPLSLAEWFMGYWTEAMKKYGPRVKDEKVRGVMKMGICGRGEVVYVPSGWWHIVVNLEPSIAVTQNFVSQRELPKVLKFMRDRPEQASGFKLNRGHHPNQEDDIDCDDFVQDVFEKFVEALKGEHREMVQDALDQIGGMSSDRPEEKEMKKGLWEAVQDQRNGDGGFSFGFSGDDYDDLDDLE